MRLFFAPFSAEVAERSRKNVEKKEIANPEKRENVYTGLEIPNRIILDMKYEELLNRMRIYEEAMLGARRIIHRLDEDYQLAKQKKKIACMCVPSSTNQKV